MRAEALRKIIQYFVAKAKVEGITEVRQMDDLLDAVVTAETLAEMPISQD